MLFNTRDTCSLPQALCTSAHHLSQQIRSYIGTQERKSAPGRQLIKVTVGGQEERKLLVWNPAKWRHRSRVLLSLNTFRSKDSLTHKIQFSVQLSGRSSVYSRILLHVQPFSFLKKFPTHPTPLDRHNKSLQQQQSFGIQGSWHSYAVSLSVCRLLSFLTASMHLKTVQHLITEATDGRTSFF